MIFNCVITHEGDVRAHLHPRRSFIVLYLLQAILIAPTATAAAAGQPQVTGAPLQVATAGPRPPFQAHGRFCAWQFHAASVVSILIPASVGLHAIN